MVHLPERLFSEPHFIASLPECACSTETIFRIGRASRIANEKPARKRTFQVTRIRNGTTFINPLAREFGRAEFCSTASALARKTRRCCQPIAIQCECLLSRLAVAPLENGIPGLL